MNFGSALYASGLDPEHYEKARASPRWSEGWARRLADMLAAEMEFDAELEVLGDAGLDSEMLAALMQDGTAHAVSEYRGMADAYPDRYYAICRRLAEDLVGGHGDEEHRAGSIRECLQIMGGIPGHRAEFEEFCGRMLRDRDVDVEVAGVIRDAADGA